MSKRERSRGRLLGLAGWCGAWLLAAACVAGGPSAPAQPGDLDASAPDASSPDHDADPGALDASGPDADPGDANGPDADPRDAASDATDPPLDAASDPDVPLDGDGCGLPPGANDREWSIEHGGLRRRFRVHLPTGYDPARPTPVVLDFHGRAMNAGLQIALTGMNQLADAEGFIAVHPEGTGQLEQVWNAGLCCGSAVGDGVDDVGFVEAMLDALERALCVDPRRVYATGMSNGGFFAHRLGCELSERIAAIAPVAGTMATFDCAPTRTMPVFHFHGTADNVVPYEGFGGFISVEATMRDWASRNGCQLAAEVFFERDDVRCERWPGCRDGAQVQLCTVEGGGHAWPGGFPIPLLGETTRTISATEMMWDFFQRHAR